jgi:hypothetical protein
VSRRGLPATPKSLLKLRRHYERWGMRRVEGDVLYSAWDEFLNTHISSESHQRKSFFLRLSISPCIAAMAKCHFSGGIRSPCQRRFPLLLRSAPHKFEVHEFA